MKKNLLFAMALSLAALVSCNKDIVDNQQLNKVTVSAVAEESLFTKTDYAILGSTATFSWTAGDKFGRLYKPSNYALSEYVATSVDGASAVFSGDEPSGVTKYALYPYGSANGANLAVKEHTNVYFQFPSTIEYNVSSPLQGIVPMLGVADGNAFTFYALGGVICIHAINIPETAASITLTTTAGTKGLSGESVMLTSTGNIDGLNLTTIGMRRGWINNNNTGVTLTFTPGTFTTADFYFPVPVSKNASGANDPYFDLKIVLKDDTNNVLDGGTVNANGVSIVVNRGEIVRLADIDFLRSTTVLLSGESSSPYAYVGKFGPGAVKVKYAIAASADEAKTAAETGIEVTSTGESNKFDITPTAGTTGFYYLGYQVLSSGGVLGTYARQFYYSTVDASEAVGTYAYTGAVPWSASNETVTWTFAATTNDFSKGNIKITGTSIWGLTGNIYGVYDGSKITIDGHRTVFRPNNQHCIIGRWDSTTNEQGSDVGELIDVVFTKDGNNLTTSKIGIGYNQSTPYLVEPLTTVYLSSRYLPNQITWVKQP